MDFQNQIIAEARDNAMENLTTANNVVHIKAGCTLTSDMLRQIKESKKKAFSFWELLDEPEKVQEKIENDVNYNYIPGAASRDDLRRIQFLVSDAKISNIHSTDDRAGTLLGCSFWSPYLQGIMDVNPHIQHDGEKRRLIPIFDTNGNRLINIVNGNEHAVLHSLKNENVTMSHILFSKDSVFSYPVRLPSGLVHGGSPFCIDLKPRNKNETKLMVVPRGNPPLLHAHVINNENIYNKSSDRPTYSVFLRPSGTKGIQSDIRVNLKPGMYQNNWVSHIEQYRTPKGHVVPLKEFAEACIDFVDNLDSTRHANLHDNGLWFDVDYYKPIEINFVTELSIIPIVKKFKDGEADYVQWENLVQHLQNNLSEQKNNE